MPISTIYEIELIGEKWMARLGDEYLDRAQMLARIKSKIKQGVDAEEEWAAYAILERRAAEDRWRNA